MLNLDSEIKKRIADSLCEFFYATKHQCFIGGSMSVGLSRKESDIDIIVYCHIDEFLQLYHILTSNGFIKRSEFDYSDSSSDLFELGNLIDVLVQRDLKKYKEDEEFHKYLKDTISKMDSKGIEMIQKMKESGVKGATIYKLLKEFVRAYDTLK